jgi:hypothetical protein
MRPDDGVETASPGGEIDLAGVIAALVAPVQRTAAASAIAMRNVDRDVMQVQALAERNSPPCPVA